ncbi:MAG: PHP domain-containing protein [Candidatus Dormibacteria bacterium]
MQLSEPEGRPAGAQRLTNSQLAEMLFRASEQSEGHLVRALHRAHAAAFTWPVSAYDLHQRGEDLTRLSLVGPRIAAIIRGWIDSAVPAPEPPPERAGFLSMAEVGEMIVKPLPLRGDLHMHSTWSDGGSEITDLADAARALDYEYIGITDHSVSLKVAGGMDADRFGQQRREIDQINAALESGGASLRVLQGIEMDLDLGGAGDMDGATLAALDHVIGSFHSKLRLKEDQTERYLAAVENRDVHILGHPRGRMYNRRVGLACDWPRVFARAAELGKAVDIDSFPYRQDLDVELIRIAVAEGTLLNISSDSHAASQFWHVEIGVAAATLAGAPLERVINTWSLERIREWVGSLRES